MFLGGVKTRCISIAKSLILIRDFAIDIIKLREIKSSKLLETFTYPQITS
ncbi:hypothetical protein HDE68_004061 [Pedobacter cryoconitis]|uniref:Uncharacterized protein n=1 Tax=Pedobacter cryoconitis TaxID=188932 RepID=A0A7W8ZQI1_9SPHI|nr:hypothetical protein [Pedobacter cryoconitis]